MSPRSRLLVALLSTAVIGYIALGSLLGRVLGDTSYGQLAIFNEVVRLVLEAYVELDRSAEELSNDGFDPDVVERAVALIDRAEYKRRQAPPGVKITPRAFGRDWRLPIVNRFRHP